MTLCEFKLLCPEGGTQEWGHRAVTLKKLPNCLPQWTPPARGMFLLILVTWTIPWVRGVSLGTDGFATHRSSMKCLVWKFCPIFYTGFLLIVGF